ncbi:MAG: AAA family ATPase [Magnetococcales bacterium]|nr:AAA family ATPase [Magnetococcales bacterium]
MVFQEIKIVNLFSYRGDQGTFDLTGQTPERPILLINGRNGFGKTSFLNAVKLLFSGPCEDLRNEVQAGRKLGPKQYMLGYGEEWMGVFNRRPHQKRLDSYYVHCRWREADGVVDARREWFPDSQEFDSTGLLTIQTTFLEKPLKGPEAQEFLEKRLPTPYLPFFFFDGEKIQKLAEANRNTLEAQVEGILNIAPIKSLLDYLDKAKRKWAQAGAVGEAKQKFNQIQRDLEALSDQLTVLKTKRKDQQSELEALAEQIDDLDHRKRNMQIFRAREEETNLKGKLATVRERLAKLRQDVVEQFIPVSPLAVNPLLVDRLLLRLEKEDQGAWAKKEFLIYLRSFLPVQVFERPAPPTVRLHQEQQRFFRGRLEQALDDDALKDDQNPGRDGLKLDGGRQMELRRMLIGISESKPLLGHARILREVSLLTREEVAIQQQLDDISTVVEADRERFLQVQADLKARQDEKEALVHDMGKLDGESAAAERELKRKQDELRDQEKKTEQTRQSNAYRDKADQLAALFKDYKAGLKTQRRDALQKAINTHFKTLMTSHDMIRAIHVDDNFGLHYLDAAEQAIGGGNLSAGMKQLAAISLLWALKSVSGKSVPVIVDTPLARIDRQNQENLLQSYFPQVAEQVIILPTDSELDREKYRLLAPYIYREYTLENPHGDCTEVKSKPMYPE